MTTSTNPANDRNNALYNLYSNSSAVWSYLGNTIQITKCALNGLALSERFVSLAGENTPKKIENLVTHLKLFSLASVVFTLPSVKSSFEKTVRCFQIRDFEEAALNAISFAITTCDAAESAITFINTSLKLNSKRPIEILSKLGLPLVYAICSMSILSKTITIAKTYYLYQSLKGVLAKEDTQLGQALKALLDEKLKDADEKKRAALLRSANDVVVVEMEKLSQLSADANVQQLRGRVEMMAHELETKVALEVTGIFASVLTIVGLRSLSETPRIFPFGLLGSSFGLRLAPTAYRDFSSPAVVS